MEKVSLGIGALSGDTTKLERFIEAVFNPVKYEDPSKLSMSQKVMACGSKLLLIPVALLAMKRIKIV